MQTKTATEKQVLINAHKVDALDYYRQAVRHVGYGEEHDIDTAIRYFYYATYQLQKVFELRTGLIYY